MLSRDSTTRFFTLTELTMTVMNLSLYGDKVSSPPWVRKLHREDRQGEIFEAGPNHVVKLFDLNFSPEAVMTRGLLNIESFHIGSHMVRASLVEDENDPEVDGRFYIVMRRFWGDLRKLIDQHMMGSNNQGPPFTTKQVLWLMHAIAYDMWCLHKNSILHRDLKASNVLLEGTESPSLDARGNFELTVADYESSDGVVGTRFWRAPEILQQLKDRKHLVLKFTEECDVYSFGMTCYELVTGCIPFEGYGASNYDLVLSGTRPELPDDVDPLVKEIMTSCWHPDPSKRPNFLDICSWVANAQVGRHMSGAKHGHDQTLVEVIPKYWGDLRMLIGKLTRPYSAWGEVDHNLVSDPGVGFPALNTKQDLRLMHAIARAMCDLHEGDPPIIYGGLEASNVLVCGDRSCPSLDEDGNYMVSVAHYKCINGDRMTSYTEIWLAPEIIQQINNMGRKFFWYSDLDVFVTIERDVYSYGMTCYELVTGRTPFDDEFDVCRARMQMREKPSYLLSDLRKRILNGSRPKLPADLDPLVEAIIISCWNHDPSQRPTFLDICNRIANWPGFQPSSLH